jgi:predicted XRE-type DNA-binding protein
MKVNPIIARNAVELAEVLGLSPADALEWEARRQINDKIVAAIKKSGLTHAQVAKVAGTSRSRVTAIVNRNRGQVSTDLMLRILTALGYRIKVSFARIRRAA